jgi:putative nucleotidyltransferase with HDIG domain
LYPEYIAITKDTPIPPPELVHLWWDEYKMLDNIRAHSRMVSQVALLVNHWLGESGLTLRQDAILAGALAHDIAKTQCLNSDRLHSEEGYEILKEKGYPELAYLVRVHVYLPEGHPLDEAMVVNYADKRVKHDHIVGLDDRYDYIEKRYGRGEPERIARIAKGRARAFSVEDVIFNQIGLAHKPSEISNRLEGAAA